MKHIIIFIISILIISPLFALDLEKFEGKQYILDSLLETIDRPRPPVVDGDYIIFTSSPDVRHTGIAFDFEEYKQIHSFRRLVRQNEDGNNTNSFVSFYILEIPENTQNISYRLVMDGLWTVDPQNEVSVYDRNLDLRVSNISLNRPHITETKTTQKTIRFVYEGETGQKIRLAGTFTNWDPFIYELTETSYGFYELELALPKGTYYYTYHSGLNSFLDETNPDKAYTNDGRVASVVILQ